MTMTETSERPWGLLSWYRYDHGPHAPTHLAKLALSPANRVADLLVRAKALAPAVTMQAWSSGCTVARPEGAKAAQAWDLVAEALAWKLLSKDPRMAQEATERIRRGEYIKVSYDIFTEQPTLRRVVQS
jgi:hypothetical protein